MTIPRPYKTTVHTNAELFELWQKLMGPGGFGRRSLWLLFLDVENRVLPTARRLARSGDDVLWAGGAGRHRRARGHAFRRFGNWAEHESGLT